jgi:hypothetical protein
VRKLQKKSTENRNPALNTLKCSALTKTFTHIYFKISAESVHIFSAENPLSDDGDEETTDGVVGRINLAEAIKVITAGYWPLLAKNFGKEPGAVAVEHFESSEETKAYTLEDLKQDGPALNCWVTYLYSQHLMQSIQSGALDKCTPELDVCRHQARRVIWTLKYWDTERETSEPTWLGLHRSQDLRWQSC